MVKPVKLPSERTSRFVVSGPFHELSKAPLSPGARKMSTVYHPNMRGLFKEQSRMIVFRRELSRSKSVRDGRAVAQEPIEDSPYRILSPGIKTL